MIIGLHGYATVGKDEVAKVLVEELDFIQLSFAASLKQALYNLNPLVKDNRRVQYYVDQFGWDVSKKAEPEIRQLLQRLGTEVGRELFGESFWTDQVANKMIFGEDYVISDVRFENEAVFVRNRGGIVVRVNRPGVGPVNSHASDAGLPAYLIDHEFHNDGDLEDLKDKVKTFFNGLVV